MLILFPAWKMTHEYYHMQGYTLRSLSEVTLEGKASDNSDVITYLCRSLLAQFPTNSRAKLLENSSPHEGSWQLCWRIKFRSLVGQRMNTGLYVHS